MATQAARDALEEQTASGERAPEGALGDKDAALARDSSGNFVLSMLRKAYAAVKAKLPDVSDALIKGAANGVAKKIVDDHWPQIIEFVHRHAAELTAFIHNAFNAPGLSHIIELIKKLL